MERLYLAPDSHKSFPGWGVFLGSMKVRRSPKEWVATAERLAKNNGGKLQSARLLEEMGLQGLCIAMRRHSELFDHIDQEKPQGHFKTPKEWVPIAEELAIGNGGKLQSAWFLTNNGHSRLADAMRRHPDLFAHIEQEKPYENRRTPEQWVLVAEEIARENGGLLKGYGWLYKNGFRGLAVATKRRPELFSHIEVEWRSTGFKKAVGQGEAA